MAPEAHGVTTLQSSNGRMPSESQAVRDMIVCINPATRHVLGEVRVTTTAQAEAAVVVAREAQRGWRRLRVQERAHYLLEARERLMDRREELLELLVEETGKPRPDAASELLNLFETITYYAQHGPDLLSDQKLSLHLLRNKRARVEYAPVGVVLNISPWNVPLDMAISPIIAALIAGNAAIIKPSELAPLTAITAANIINDAGLPRGILQVLPGYGELGAHLCTLVDGVTFTGSVETGREIGRITGERLIPCTLELGGKDAMIVLNDADLERASHAAVWGSFFHCGQTCISVERVYVQDDVYDDFVARVLTLTRQLRQGDPIADDIDLGAMTEPAQIAIVERHIADARKKGARILCGGKRIMESEGFYFEPTILVDVTDDMLLIKEETVGPVMPIVRVRSPAEAIQRTNDSRFGLGASVWAKNTEVAHEVARQLDVGGVCINDVLVHFMAIEAPFGGNKNSGLGRRKGANEIYTFTNAKTVLEDILQLKREPFWYPYNSMVGTALDKAMAMLYRKKITRKITDLFGRG